MASTRTTKKSLTKTGQTTSYVDYDDGYYEKGSSISPRFVDNNDGTLTDRLTGLMYIIALETMIPGATGVTSNNHWINNRLYWATETAYAVGDFANDSAISAQSNWVSLVSHTSATIYVSGTLNPDATGVYERYGSKNGQPRYKHVSASWYIWWKPIGGMFDEWVICNDPDTTSGDYWHKADLAPPSALYGGGYTPLGGATGTATIATVTFAQDRTARPTYWREITFLTLGGMGTIYQTAVLWADLITFAKNLDFAGYTDWRVPNINEVMSVIDWENQYSVYPEFDLFQFQLPTSTTAPDSTNYYVLFQGSVYSMNYLKSNVTTIPSLLVRG